MGAVADTPEGLKSLLGDVERFSEESGIEVNEQKTKVIIFRKGEKRCKESWKYKGKELEVVSEYKYLGFWFTAGNSYRLHIQKWWQKLIR